VKVDCKNIIIYYYPMIPPPPIPAIARAIIKHVY